MSAFGKNFFGTEVGFQSSAAGLTVVPLLTPLRRSRTSALRRQTIRTGWIECSSLRKLRVDPGPVPVKPVANVRQRQMSVPELWIDRDCAFGRLQRLFSLLFESSTIGAAIHSAR